MKCAVEAVFPPCCHLWKAPMLPVLRMTGQIVVYLTRSTTNQMYLTRHPVQSKSTAYFHHTSLFFFPLGSLIDIATPVPSKVKVQKWSLHGYTIRKESIRLYRRMARLFRHTPSSTMKKESRSVYQSLKLLRKSPSRAGVLGGCVGSVL